MGEQSSSSAVDRPSGRVRGGPRRSRRERRHDRPEDERAEALKERVYATFTGLAIVLVQLSNVEHISAVRAAVTLLVGIIAITAAGFVAEVIAHLAVHAAFPGREELGRMVRVSGSAVASAALPLILLALAAFGVFPLEAALVAASIVYLATLALIGYVAVRRTKVTWWKQLAALGALVALGLAVIVLQQLAHGH